MSVEYVFLDPQTLEPSETGILYRKTSFSIEAINETKIETIRIDNDTVEDVSYTFDLELGEYVEQSRTQRAEPLPIPPPTDAEKITQLEQELAQTNTDLQAILEMVLFPS